MVGHSYIVYGPLLHGCTTVLYEGKPVGTPDAGAFWRVCADHGVDVLFTAPTAIRAIKRDDPRGEHVRNHDLSRLRTLFLAGERCDPDTLAWAERILGRPVIDHWWQTETGWAIAANCIGLDHLPVRPGSSAKAVPGYDLRVLGEGGEEAAAGEIGSLCVKLPLPPGCSPTLWGSDQRWIDAYLSRYEGYYLTADAGYIDEEGYVFVMSRTDDVINTAGHRLSTSGACPPPSRMRRCSTTSARCWPTSAGRPRPRARWLIDKPARAWTSGCSWGFGSLVGLRL